MSTVSVAEPILAGPLRPDHLDRLVDRRGITQFAHGRVPDRASGYCVDDVARLGIVAAGLLRHRAGGRRGGRWARLAVGFLRRAWDPGARALHNMLGPDGTWLDEPHHGDHTGRAVWALGILADCRVLPERVRRDAARLLAELAPVMPGLSAFGVRPVAYAVLGLRRVPPAALSALDTARPGADWPWFEPRLTYDNARLPQALLRAAVRLGDRAAAARALAVLDWYLDLVGLRTGPPRLVGNLWWEAGSGHGGGDEQPLDAAALAEALTDAWRYTREPSYAALAARAFAWFHGGNRLGVPVYDPGDGGCRDGLGAEAANENRGAESTVVYHQALLRLCDEDLTTLCR